MKKREVLRRLVRTASLRQLRDEHYHHALKARCDTLKTSLALNEGAIAAYETEIRYCGGEGRYSRAAYADVLARQAQAMHQLAALRLEREDLVVQRDDEDARLAAARLALTRATKKHERMQRNSLAAVRVARNAAEQNEIHDIIEIKSYVQTGGSQGEF